MGIKLKDILLERFNKQEVVDRVYPLIAKSLGRAKRGTPKVEFHTNIYARLSGDQQATGEANPSIIAGGLKVALLSPLFGLFTFSVSKLSILILRIVQK